MLSLWSFLEYVDNNKLFYFGVFVMYYCWRCLWDFLSGFFEFLILEF